MLAQTAFSILASALLASLGFWYSAQWFEWPIGSPRESKSLLILTKSGLIRGQNIDGIASFQGIPFAEAPIQELRWKPPREKTSWSGVWNATKFSSICPQSSGPDIAGAEDCLYLNVYSSQLPHAKRRSVPKQPVLVYVHGGSLVSGDGRSNWSAFMHHACTAGCVVVTIQYRLDVLGWLANKALSVEQGGASGNYGLLDQQMALRWVQQNIAAFGGDADRVTIAGQSSGGTSIFALLASPASRGLFHRAISLSGSPNVSLDLSAAEAQNEGITAGCDPNSPHPVFVHCLRKKSVRQLLEARPSCWTNPVQNDLPNSATAWKQRGAQCGLPVIDGRTLVAPIREAMLKAVVDVPFLVGNVGWEIPGDLKNMSPSDCKSMLSNSFSSFGKHIGIEVYEAFRAEAKDSINKAYAAILTTLGLTCAVPSLARSAISGDYKSPIYAFVNNWSPAGWRPSSGIPRWAFHTWDLTVVTETWPSGYSPAAEDLQHTRFLQTAWYGLMQSGRLESTRRGGWMPINEIDGWPQTYNTMVIQGPSETQDGPSMQSSYKGHICKLFESVGIDQRDWWVN